MRTRLAGAAAGFLAALGLVAGCGGDNMAEVGGTVTVDGKPAEKGSISFIPVDGKSPTAGGEIAQGKYSARVPTGQSKVEIRVPKVVGKKKVYDAPDSPVQDVLEEVLPPKFNDETELRFDVKRGKNEKDWDLSTKK